MKIRETTRLVFSSKNISTLQFKWVEEESSNHIVIGGFRLKWYLEGFNEASTNGRGTNWKLKRDQTHSMDRRIMRTALNLVREARKHKVSERDIWNSVLKQRWNINTLSRAKVCLTNRAAYQHKIIKAAQELNLTISFDSWIPEGDLALGAQLLSAIWYCPHQLVEAAKLSVFFEFLLTNHSLEAVVAATMNSIQPRGGNTIKDFTAMNMWYNELDKRYNFSIDPIVATLSTSDQLKQLKKLDPPFMKDVNGNTLLNGHERISHFIGTSRNIQSLLIDNFE